METALVLQFALTAGLFSLMPGADWAYAITAGLRSRSIVAPILGLASGYVVVVSVIAVGVGAVVASSPGILTALTVVGASYILWLGVSTLLGVKSGDGTLVSVTGTESAYRSDSLRQYLHGMGVSGIIGNSAEDVRMAVDDYLTNDHEEYLNDDPHDIREQ